MEKLYATTLLSRKDVAEITGLSRKRVSELFLMDGFPVWGEYGKGQHAKTPYGEFMKWYGKQITRR